MNYAKLCIRIFLVFWIILVFSNNVIDCKENRKISREYYEVECEITAYCYGTVTATGSKPHVGVIAVDPTVIPYGTKIYVPGYGYGIAEDCGGAIIGYKLDIFMNSEEECLNWGRRWIKIRIYKR